jgi:uncharacterized peroxidase-related enzyme
MRLAIFDSGQSFKTKALFAFIRLITRQPTLEIMKLVSYRPDFFGKPMGKVTHEAMRGPSSWSVGDRELMAAFVSQENACKFCISAHTAVAARAYGDAPKVAAVLADLDNAPVGEPLRATLRMLGKLTRENEVTADDMRAVLAAGVAPDTIEDALSIAFAFNATNRLADAFGFALPGPAAFDAGARYLLARGYR